jgi:aspartyl protease family protein
MARFSAHMTWILILVMLTYGFNSYLESKRNPNGALVALEEGSGALTLLADRRGQYHAPGRINGRTVGLILDTGATYVSLPETLASELNLPIEGKSFAQTANGTIAVKMTTLESVQIGSIKMEQVPAMISPGLEGDVLLGMSFLKHLELVQIDGKLELRVP